MALAKKYFVIRFNRYYLIILKYYCVTVVKIKNISLSYTSQVIKTWASGATSLSCFFVNSKQVSLKQLEHQNKQKLIIYYKCWEETTFYNSNSET